MSTQSTVLFVDDEEFILKAVQRTFRNESFGLLFATSGQEALEVLEQTPVAVVVSDFRMPEMTGGELLRVVSEKWPDTVRIILSGYADISSVISAINDGEIYKFVSKPWQGDELKEVICSGIARHQEQVRLQQLAEAALSQNDLLQGMQLDSERSLSRRNLELETEVDSLAVYKDLFDALPIPALLLIGTTLVDHNQAASELLGRPVSALDSESERESLALLGEIASVIERGEMSSEAVIDGKTYRIEYRMLSGRSAQSCAAVFLFAA